MTIDQQLGEPNPWLTAGRHTAERLLLVVSGSIMAGFGVGAAIQTEIYHASGGVTPATPQWWADFGLRVGANFVTVGVALALLAILRVAERPRWGRFWCIALTAVIGAIVWVSLQSALDLSPLHSPLLVMLALMLGAFVVVLGSSVGSLLVGVLQRLRAEEMRAYTQSATAAAALAALQSEELRVRRDVAEGLHGSVQQRLVLVGARIDEVIRQITEGSSRNEAIANLISLRADLDHLRQVDVREMSQMLYPDGLEVGLAQAVRIMVRRVPSTIAVDLSIAHAVSELDSYESGLNDMQRLALIRIIEEGVSNALRHGHASSLRVSLDYVDQVVRIEVEDDGSGLPSEPHLGGLGLLGHRLELLGGHLQLRPSPSLGGALLTAQLPMEPEHEGGAEAEPLTFRPLGQDGR